MGNKYELKISVPSSVEYSELFGVGNINITELENKYDVCITPLHDGISILGEEDAVCMTANAIKAFIVLIKEGQSVDETALNYVTSVVEEDGDFDASYGQVVCHTYKGKTIKCKTKGQRDYIFAIEANDIVFGLGPAGTGKTYLAIAMAVAAFKKGDVERIILVRPAIEAGEHLGFLPGDLKDKVDPYLRPMYDALYDIMGMEACERNLAKNSIEIAPLAYMRGRTLDNSFIILDEAQNTTPEQMKMFLTRLGFGSKAVITGDKTQVDLPFKDRSGLYNIEDILDDVRGVEFIKLTNADVVRNPIVQRIINAYEKYEKQHES